MKMDINSLIEKGFEPGQINLLLQINEAGIKGFENIQDNVSAESMRKFKVIAENYNTGATLNKLFVKILNHGSDSFLDYVDGDVIKKGSSYISKLYTFYNLGGTITSDILTLDDRNLRRYIAYYKNGYDIINILKGNKDFTGDVVDILSHHLDLDISDISPDYDAKTVEYICESKEKNIKYDFLLGLSSNKRKALLKYNIAGLPVEKLLKESPRTIEYLCTTVDSVEWDRIIKTINDKKLDAKTAHLYLQLFDKGIEFNDVLGNNDAKTAREIMRIAFFDEKNAHLMYSRSDIEPAVACKLYGILQKHAKESEFEKLYKVMLPILKTDDSKLKIVDTMLGKHFNYKNYETILTNNYDWKQLVSARTCASAGLDIVGIYNPKIDSSLLEAIVRVVRAGIDVDMTKFLNKLEKKDKSRDDSER